MSKTVEKALAAWGMESAGWSLIAARENQVFRVDHAGRSFALRLHRPGYRTDAELWSELKWMDAVSKGGLHVPAPIRSVSGNVLHVIDNTQIDMLNWLSGAPVGQTGEALDVNDRTGLFRAMGLEMARLHAVSDDWDIPEGFSRCSWDRAGLLGEAPLWDRFWDNPTLSPGDRDLFLTTRDVADRQLQEVEAALDYGLIHADLVRENVMVDGDKLQLIDFDDSGFGFRLFDVATTLLKNLSEPDYADLRRALIEGYRSARPLDTTNLDLFILLRALTYVGWIITRLDEDGSEVRNTRFVTNARRLARGFLAHGSEEIAPR